MRNSGALRGSIRVKIGPIVAAPFVRNLSTVMGWLAFYGGSQRNSVYLNLRLPSEASVAGGGQGGVAPPGKWIHPGMVVH